MQFYTHLALLVLLNLILVQVLVFGFEIDNHCRNNGMRKPPRFGKRAGEDGKQREYFFSTLSK